MIPFAKEKKNSEEFDVFQLRSINNVAVAEKTDSEPDEDELAALKKEFAAEFRSELPPGL